MNYSNRKQVVGPWKEFPKFACYFTVDLHMLTLSLPLQFSPPPKAGGDGVCAAVQEEEGSAPEAFLGPF